MRVACATRDYRQARTSCRATGTTAGEQPLVNLPGICEELLVVVRIHSEYVRHVLKGGPGVWRDFAGAVASPAPNLSATGPDLHSERAPHRKASPLAIGELPAQDAILRQRGSAGGRPEDAAPHRPEITSGLYGHLLMKYQREAISKARLLTPEGLAARGAMPHAAAPDAWTDLPLADSLLTSPTNGEQGPEPPGRKPLKFRPLEWRAILDSNQWPSAPEGAQKRLEVDASHAPFAIANESGGRRRWHVACRWPFLHANPCTGHAGSARSPRRCDGPTDRERGRLSPAHLDRDDLQALRGGEAAPRPDLDALHPHRRRRSRGLHRCQRWLTLSVALTPVASWTRQGEGS